MTEEKNRELVAVQPSIVRAVDTADQALAFEQWQSVQGMLDRAMPGSVMQIQGKTFRKRAWWRGAARMFNLGTQLISENRVQHDGDWGYEVIYEAQASNGSTAIGDGACMASEKRGAMRTLHNVRAHAHTRAMNRAIANLVGFGEVTLDELPDHQIQAAYRERSMDGPPAERDVTPPNAPPSRQLTGALEAIDAIKSRGELMALSETLATQSWSPGDRKTVRAALDEKNAQFDAEESA